MLQKPGPDGPLVISTIALFLVPFINPLIGFIFGRKASQTSWSQQLPLYHIKDRFLHLGRKWTVFDRNRNHLAGPYREIPAFTKYIIGQVSPFLIPELINK